MGRHWRGSVSCSHSAALVIKDRVPAGFGRRGEGRRDQLGALNVGFMERLQSFNLDAELNAMEQAGRGCVISNPHVFTTDRHQAKIIKGFQVQYQQYYSKAMNGVPPINTTSLTSRVLSGFGRNVALGGVYSDTDSTVVRSVPFLDRFRG